MGIFRKTLEDAKKKAAKGDLNDVLRILQERKSECTAAWSDLLGVKQSLKKYEESVDKAIEEVNNPKKDRKAIEEKIGTILHWLNVFKKHMHGLIKDEKVKLK